MVAALAKMESADKVWGSGADEQRRQGLHLTGTTFVLLWRLQKVDAHWPLGACVQPLTFCGLDNERKGNASMSCHSLKETKYYGGVHR